MCTRAFALLGLGSLGRAFRDQELALDRWRISWIRWLDRAWLLGESRPSLSFEVPADQAIDPFAELTEEWLDHCPEAGRFVFSIDDPAPWEDAEEMAKAAADAAAGLLALTSPLSQELGVAELDPQWVKAGEVLLQDVEARDSQRWDPPWLTGALRESVHLPRDATSAIIDRVGPAMADGDPRSWGVLPALTYHQLAMQEFAFAPDDVREVMANPEVRPDRPFERARAEASFHNAWKSIEAALGGELNSDDARLTRWMGERGLVAESVPRFPDHANRSLRQRLRRLQRVRDRQSAHGGRTGVSRGVVTYFDLVEVQWMAAAVMLSILDKDKQRHAS